MQPERFHTMEAVLGTANLAEYNIVLLLQERDFKSINTAARCTAAKLLNKCHSSGFSFHSLLSLCLLNVF